MDIEIKAFVKSLCEILGTEWPELIYDSSRLTTKTMMAALSPEGLHLPTKPKKTADLFFSIAHEMRHKWQREKSGKDWLLGYQEAGAVSAEEYNQQPIEVDANAFAYVVMVDMFGVEPQFNGLSDATKAMINHRASEIVKEITEV